MGDTVVQKQLLVAVEALRDEVRLSREAQEKANQFQETLLTRIAPEFAKSRLVQIREEQEAKIRSGARKFLGKMSKQERV